MPRIYDMRMHDGSRHFAGLPETKNEYAIRDHVAKLEGATLTGFVTDDATEAWLDFTFRGQVFSINNQHGEWWFFVTDPRCPEDVLEAVVDHFEELLEPQVPAWAREHAAPAGMFRAVVLEADGRVTWNAVLGTATLFRVRERVFLVTAAHSFDHLDPDELGIPVKNGGRSAFATLDGCRRNYFDDPDHLLDICIVEILPDELRAEIEETPEAVKITTTHCGGQVPRDYDPSRDLLLKYEASSLQNAARPSLRLYGVSGSAVWGVRSSDTADGLWQPSHAVRLVGVQVASEFEKIDPDVGRPAIRQKTVPRI